MKVAIVGTGYVGLTTGVALAYLGHDVSCIDVDPAKVAQLKKGFSPIYEPFLPELMKAASAKLKFTTEYSEAVPMADVVFIAVGTPSLPDGNPNLVYLKSAAESVGKYLGSNLTVIVNKSTVPIGSGNWVESIVRDACKLNGAPKEFAVVSNPEFLREGSALSDMLYADRIVVGSDQQNALQVMQKLYQPILDQTFAPPDFLPRPKTFTKVNFLATDLQSAELIKYAANAFLALKISFINEVAELAERVGANTKDIATGIGWDSRIGPKFLQAGIGWGGSCFGKDTLALISTAREYGLPMAITQAAREVNSRQRGRVVEILLNEMKILKGKKIGILGFAFKPFTDDLRDAPAYELSKRLTDRGAKVVGFDPIAMERATKEWGADGPIHAKSIDEVFDESDAVVLVTEWPEFLKLDWAKMTGKMKTKFLIDGRAAWDETAIRSVGAKLVVLGKSS